MTPLQYTRSRPHRGRRVILIAGASVVGLLAGGLAVILGVGGILVPATYLQPWSAGYSQQFSDPRMKVVAQALLAPSGHNMQPWIIRLDDADPTVLSLYADADRLTPAVDPLGRQTMITQGTFLAYLEVAAANLGYSASFDLFPNGAFDETELDRSMRELPVARITLAPDATAETSDYGSLFLSDTNRAPYTADPLSAAQTKSLGELDAGSAATLSVLTDPDDLATLGSLAEQGTRIETEYAAATSESDAVFHSTEQAKNDARSGFAVEGQGTSGLMKYFLQGLITIVPAVNDDATAATNAIALTAAGVANTAAYGLIRTTSNSRTEQVEAGILYAQLSLRTRTLGLVLQPLSQVLQEYPTMAAPYAAVHEQYAPGGGTIQMLVRIGTPTTEFPPTMRRDATSLLAAP
ncbi:Acg family FMN-binding oxidoreductase [Herbiconiux liangxiaofengii]|uniref:Acg family FMN-binding oxidoreductase n=1 Tax=Herbiconiux liangxiaofengii TaxID=3342795 RepID=UPI0035B7ECD8